MSQKLLVNNFKWIKDTSQFNEDLKKTIMKIVGKTKELKRKGKKWKMISKMIFLSWCTMQFLEKTCEWKMWVIRNSPQENLMYVFFTVFYVQENSCNTDI